MGANLTTCTSCGREYEMLLPNNIYSFLQNIVTDLRLHPLYSDLERYQFANHRILMGAIRSFSTRNGTQLPSFSNLQQNPNLASLKEFTPEKFLYDHNMQNLKEYFEFEQNYYTKVQPSYEGKFSKSSFEIFKYTDIEEYYIGFCTGAVETASSENTVSFKAVNKNEGLINSKVINAVPNGYGILLSLSSNKTFVKVMEGIFMDNVFKEGQFIDEKCIYSGLMKDEKLNGIGTLFFANGKISRGNFDNCELTGNDCILYLPQEYGYRGVCKNNEMSRGQLVFFYHQTLARYVGMISNGKPEGEGTMEYKDGSVYEGSWKDGIYQGAGKFTSTFEFYEGNYENGQRSGIGKLERKQGDTKEIYDGDWKENLMHGVGSITTLVDGKPVIKKVLYKFGKLEKYIEE